MRPSPLRDTLHLERSWASRRFLTISGVLALVVTLILLVLGQVLDSATRLLVLTMMSSLGLALGCLMSGFALGFIQVFRRTVRWTLLAIFLSQAGYFLLLWSGWKTHSLPWRFWWVSMVLSLHLTHMLFLRWARSTDRTRSSSIAIISAVATAAIVASLALREDLLGPIPTWGGCLLALLATTTVVTTLVLAWRILELGERSWTLTPGWRRTLLVLSHGLALAAGLYLGHVAISKPPDQTTPTALAHLSPEAIAAKIEADLRELETVVSGLHDLEREMAALQESVRSRRESENRDYFLPEEDDALRWQFVTFLSYRTALLRQVTTYAGFEALKGPLDRARCFLMGYAAAVGAYRSGLDLVHRYGDQPWERRKLNEPEPAWGIPAGMFDRIYESVSAHRHAELCEEMAAFYQHRRTEWRRQEILPTEKLDWLEEHIDGSLEVARSRAVDRHRQWLDIVLERVRQDTYSPRYAVQSMVADWIGDIRLVDRPRLIGPEQTARVRELVRPGDILLERRSWNASNAFLPGFWPHAALYVGTIEDLADLGIQEHPEVQRRLSDYLAPSHDGHTLTVIEALGEGVIFNSLEESIRADYVAVLRPRLTDEELAAAIVKAFHHQGKPYDFEFDFFTSDKLVCTELIYRSFGGLLDLPLQHVMGRDTLPALELVRKFARERGTPGRELDFVLFLDSDPAAGRSFFADETAFVASADRMKEFNEDRSFPFGRF